VTEILTSDALCARLAEPTQDRQIVAIAGAPGSGKSTLAERIVTQANATAPGMAALFPMDGFHYDDAVLIARGRRPWKGAADTFDVGGLRATLARLRRNDEPEVAVPVFDRAIEIARAGGTIIPASVRLIVVEGNYLMLDQAPWNSLAPFWDMTVMVDVEEEVLRQRLTARWVHFGLSDAEIAHKLDGNDLPNGRLIRNQSRAPDILIRDS
jgi:pantothenate kinase